MKSFLFGLLLIVGLTYMFAINLYLNENNSLITNKSPKTIYRFQRINWSSNPYDTSSLSADDLQTLINISDFKFLINSNRCLIDDKSNDNLFLIVFIHSAPNNFDKRRAIRKTWGNETNSRHNPMRVVFLVGQVNDSSVQKSLVKESEKYSDLIQGNFIDSYRNLTYKHIMGLKWIVYFCQNAKYVFKTDDDIFVDIFQLIFYLKGTFGNSYPPKNLINCYVINNPYPKRSQRSKWRVTFQVSPKFISVFHNSLY